MCNISDNLNAILFADDTNFLFQHKHLETLLNIVNSDLKKLSLWFRVNKFLMNISKTNYIMFGMKPTDNNIQLVN